MTSPAERDAQVKLMREQIEGIRARQELNIPQDSATIYMLCDQAIAALTAHPSAGEPVAWACNFGDYAHISWGSKRPDYPIRYDIPLYAAPPVTAQGDGWLPIESAPRGRIVLVHYKNQLGNGRTMRACYYPPETLESEIEESGWADEGWYEESEAYEYLMPLEGDPTHWQPLPAAPMTAASGMDEDLTENGEK